MQHVLKDFMNQLQAWPALWGILFSLIAGTFCGLVFVHAKGVWFKVAALVAGIIMIPLCGSVLHKSPLFHNTQTDYLTAAVVIFAGCFSPVGIQHWHGRTALWGWILAAFAAVIVLTIGWALIQYAGSGESPATGYGGLWNENVMGWVIALVLLFIFLWAVGLLKRRP
jgi:hypothetical protein